MDEVKEFFDKHIGTLKDMLKESKDQNTELIAQLEAGVSCFLIEP